jgi:hypothetical protein
MFVSALTSLNVLEDNFPTLNIERRFNKPMGEVRNAYRILVWKSERKSLPFFFFLFSLVAPTRGSLLPLWSIGLSFLSFLI